MVGGFFILVGKVLTGSPIYSTMYHSLMRRLGIKYLRQIHLSQLSLLVASLNFALRLRLNSLIEAFLFMKLRFHTGAEKSPKVKKSTGKMVFMLSGPYLSTE